MNHSECSPVRPIPPTKEVPSDLPLSVCGRSIFLTLPHACQGLVFDAEAAMEFAGRLVEAAMKVDKTFVHDWLACDRRPMP